MPSSVAKHRPTILTSQSFASVIDAFLAVRGLRKHSVPDFDHF